MATVPPIPITLVIPDASGNGYPLLTAGSVHRHLTPAFLKDVVGDWHGMIRVPSDYVSTPTIILAIAANATVGVSTLGMATATAADAETYNPASYTTETDQDITVPATAYVRKDVTFSLTSTIAAGDDLMVRVRHNGTAVNDTLAVDTILVACLFQYANA